ncbi:hypothetical protein LCGC14_1961600 [marine sediment metagenome]|uniref:Uncharacterized protein n=1 Tax=marine sediment metagenome TaxID=412755 RepID=A0A0F9HSW4_9ZZZZ
MTHSIYDVAKSRPGDWIRKDDCATEDQQEQLQQVGGMIRCCPTCEGYSSPHRPCLCGVMVLQRKDNGLFWGHANGWIEDWKFHAEHFFSLDTASKVALALSEYCGVVSVIMVNTNWQKCGRPVATIGDTNGYEPTHKTSTEWKESG